MFLPCLLYLLIVSATDLRAGRIPNSVTLAFFAAALIADMFTDCARIPRGLACAAFFLAAFLASSAITKGLGAGDAKMAAAVGYCTGFARTSATFLLACMLGIIFFVMRRIRGKKGGKIPLAPFALAGYAASGLALGRMP